MASNSISTMVSLKTIVIHFHQWIIIVENGANGNNDANAESGR
jgi:hypothetical protein